MKNNFLVLSFLLLSACGTGIEDACVPTHSNDDGTFTLLVSLVSSNVSTATYGITVCRNNLDSTDPFGFYTADNQSDLTNMTNSTKSTYITTNGIVSSNIKGTSVDVVTQESSHYWFMLYTHDGSGNLNELILQGALIQ